MLGWGFGLEECLRWLERKWVKSRFEFQNPILGQVLEALRREKKWWAVPVQPLVTQRREFEALHKLRDMSVRTPSAV